MIQISENDGLPSQVCLHCVDFINKTYTFKRLCERSDLTLHQILGKTFTHSLPSSLAENKSLLDNCNTSTNIFERGKQVESCEVKLTNLTSIPLDSELLDIKILENFENNASHVINDISASLNTDIGGYNEKGKVQMRNCCFAGDYNNDSNSHDVDQIESTLNGLCSNLEAI